jgi:predicted molibdopterin-dependent oxidoreductase YjgC
MFKLPPDSGAATVAVTINGKRFDAPRGCSAAAAVLLAGDVPTRTTAVSGAPRAPYCLMGVCFDCLMEINGVPNQQACLIVVTEGMRIESQYGKFAVKA